MAKVKVAMFADERSYHMEEQIQFAGQRNIPISLRLFSISDEARLENLEKLSAADFDRVTGDLKKRRVIKHLMDATTDELKQYAELLGKHNAEVWDVGSALGKQYLGAPDFRTQFLTCLDKTMGLVAFFGTKRVRSFTFYPGTDAELKALADKPKELAELYERYRDQAYDCIAGYNCILRSEGAVPLFEVESKIYGHDARTLWSINACLDGILAYFDGANMMQQDTKMEGLSIATYDGLGGILGGIHVKDMKFSEQAGAVADEEAKWPYRPVGEGDAQYPAIFKDFAGKIESVQEQLKEHGLPGEVGFVLEPHLMCGGQFGGFTGQRFYEAIRALMKQLDAAKIEYQEIHI